VTQRRTYRFLITACLASFVLSCAAPPPSEIAKPSVPSAAQAKPQFGSWGVDLTGMDTRVKPGDDFYRYVNGTWDDKAQIPADKKAVGPMSALQDLALDQVKTLLEENAADANAAKGGDRQKIGDWYATLMHESKLAEDGIKPIQPDLDRIWAIKDRTALVDLLADNLSSLGASPLVTVSEFDRKHVDKTLVAIGAGGLSISMRDVYLKGEYAPLRKLFLEHVARVFKLAGIENADKRAARVLALETEIAKFTPPPEELRDPRKLFNPTPAKKLPKLAPGIDWPRFLERSGVGSAEIVDVKTKKSVTGMAKLIAKAPLADWRDYCAYRLINSVKALLAKPFRDEFFAFYGKVLSGQPEPDPRWRQALANLGWEGGPLTDALGKQFVDRYVPAEARPQAREMVNNLIKAFDARLAKLKWMTPETRAAAREKLSKTTIKLLYPDYWEDTDGLDVVRDDAIGNQRRAMAFLRQKNLSELTTYPDKRKFLKPVYQVNAYANPSWNEIAFLAAIIRPPAFDPAAEPVANYGAMGAFIGHEISHLFDDQGRLSDSDGLLRDWWQPEDAKKFEAVAARLAKQVGSYEVLPGKYVNGKLTLGESIADVAGLAVAYDAYRLSLNGKELPVRDGFTGNQRFFLAYAQEWRWKTRDANLERLMKTDVHPPSYIRPLTVRNIDAWYEAFNVQPGDKLYLAPEDRVNPW